MTSGQSQRVVGAGLECERVRSACAKDGVFGTEDSGCFVNNVAARVRNRVDTDRSASHT